MAEWVCDILGCHWKVAAPSSPPVHAKALPGHAQATDPKCPVHRTEMVYTQSEEEKSTKPVAADPEKVEKNPGFTLSGALLTSYDIKQQPDIRARVSQQMGISDKGHKKHGANFSSAQTLRQIIDNLFKMVQGGAVDKAAQAMITAYDYDPRSMMMASRISK